MKQKKGLLFIMLVAVGLSAFAQTSSGSMMIGGSVGVTSTSDDESGTKVTSFNLSPQFGYFLADNMALGAILDLGSTKITNGTDIKATSFGIGPMFRYYVPTSNTSLSFFAQATLLFSSAKTEVGPAINKSGAVTFAVSPGFAYFFNEHWAFDLAFSGLSFESLDPDKDVGNDKQTTVSFGITSLNPSIGMRYHF